MPDKITVKQVDYHRNGIGGEGFHAVLFRQGGEQFLGILFSQPGQCAVISLDRIDEDGVTFGANSWHGDEAEPELRRAIVSSDYPAGVLAVYDNGGDSIDRYKVVFCPTRIDGAKWYSVLYMSTDPASAGGVCTTAAYQHWLAPAAADRMIGFAALPAECQRRVTDWLVS